MGKRGQKFDRKENNYYPTPEAAVTPLLAHLGHRTEFIEPCAGDGRLIRHLAKHGHRCTYACDLEPQGEGIEKRDVLFFKEPLPSCEMIITNPPWEREYLHAMIERFRNHAPTWLLFDADWAYTAQAKPFAPYCSKIVTVGRVKWIEGTKNSGMDNCAWFRFEKFPTRTEFFWR